MVIQPATLAIIGLSGGHVPTAAQAEQTTTADASSNTKSSSDLLAEGQRIFRFDTFGDEQLWTDKLRLHEVVEKSVDPTTALSVGLKVDADVLPPGLLKKVDLKSAATTVALLKMNAIVGLRATVDANNHEYRIKDGHLFDLALDSPLDPRDIHVDTALRLESGPDAGDASNVYAISDQKTHSKGLLIDAFDIFDEICDRGLAERLMENRYNEFVEDSGVPSRYGLRKVYKNEFDRDPERYVLRIGYGRSFKPVSMSSSGRCRSDDPAPGHARPGRDRRTASIESGPLRRTDGPPAGSAMVDSAPFGAASVLRPRCA